MIYHRQLPTEALRPLINCYWHIDSEGDQTVETQKIVPDGYPEIILHYGDSYEINISGKWKAQPLYLLAGQLKHHFFLRNTGKSGMIGIKFQPAALSRHFDVDQSMLTGKVVELPAEIEQALSPIFPLLKPELNIIEVCDKLDDAFLTLTPQEANTQDIEEALALLIERKGNIGVNELTQVVNCGERRLERLFKRFVGLSPKFFARIIRLSYIFELMQEGDKSWSDLVYDSGFYDQSHFIKNFKEFTGEDPSSYGFDERNMANFHLRG